MKTTYTVVTAFGDRFSGLRLHPGQSIVLHSTRRIVEFLDANGNALTNETHSPTDADFSVIKGELDQLVTVGNLSVAAPAAKPANGNGKTAKADAAKTADPPKADPPKTDPPKVDPKADAAKTPPPPPAK